jgi:hypothetical protein
VVEASVAERVKVPVQLGADPADLALGNPAAHAQGLDEVVDLPSADTMHVGLHHHREQRPIDPATSLEKAREERALAQLGDRQLDIPSGGRHQLSTMPVALGHPAVAALMRAGADHCGRLGLD